MTGVAFNTVLKLVPLIGRACSDYQDKIFRNLKCKRVQCDEIWNFCYAKDKNVPEEMKGQHGVGRRFGLGLRLTRTRKACAVLVCQQP